MHACVAELLHPHVSSVSCLISFLPILKTNDKITVHSNVYKHAACDVMRHVVSYLYPIGCRIVNWVTTADGCVHTANTTQLGRTYSQHVQFPNFRPNPSAVVVSWLRIQYTPRAESKLRRDSTGQWTVASRRSLWCVLGLSYLMLSDRSP